MKLRASSEIFIFFIIFFCCCQYHIRHQKKWLRAQTVQPTSSKLLSKEIDKSVRFSMCGSVCIYASFLDILNNAYDVTILMIKYKIFDNHICRKKTKKIHPRSWNYMFFKIITFKSLFCDVRSRNYVLRNKSYNVV